MKYFVLMLALILLNCKEKPEATISETQTDVSKVEDNLQLEIFDFDGLQPYIIAKDDKIHVVNFWATWCAPCVKELPHFEKLNTTYSDRNVEVLLVSLDFPKDYENKLKPFIKDHNLKSKILVLNDPDMNTWIPKVDANWSGAIPATIIYNSEKRQFYEQSFDYQELKTEVDKFLKP